MESIEHRLGLEHLAGCFALSRSANWNQNEADWRLMLGFGRGWGVSLADGMLVASTLVLPYGAKFAWIAMVLVLPEHRRRGFATRLLHVALAALNEDDRLPVLDATPAGREVYARTGFRDTWGFKRYAIKEAKQATADLTGIRPLADSDWPQILDCDAQAFGAGREEVLRDLAARLPQAALVAEDEGRISGFLLGRDGREARQLGPLVARAPQTASALLDAALVRVTAPIYVDIADHAAALQARALAHGFALQRPFTRMVHGAAQAPGEAALVYCPAGPELG